MSETKPDKNGNIHARVPKDDIETRRALDFLADKKINLSKAVRKGVVDRAKLEGMGPNKCGMCGDDIDHDPTAKLCIACQIADDRYNQAPCLECGAATSKEAETMCICAGDKDSCHGTHLWED